MMSGRFIRVGRHLCNDLSKPIASPVDGISLIRRTLGPKYREAELECAKLLKGEPHRPKEMIGRHLDRLGTDEDLNSLDESAGSSVMLGDRFQVCQESFARYSCTL